ncbi:MAG: HNH endonuclease [Kiritimatiellae bacterium]|nr:HNH endonuclease [Kiritimatiellia bacterium]
MADDWVDIRKDEAHVARERAKAQALKQTPWWREQLRKGVCHYCGKEVGAENLTMDHVIPVARGGKSVQSNVVPACQACNQAKRCQTPAEQILADLEAEGTLPALDEEDLERYLDPDNWGQG